MGRQPCCDKVGLKKGPWTAEEDKKLVDFILNNGHCCWRAVPKLAGLLRCGKSCRLRWTNYLRPDLKRGVLSDMEEKLIVELHSHLGNRWAKIAAHLPGRTDNEIKNYWNTHIKKKLRRMGIDPLTHQPIADAQALPQGVIGNTETEASIPLVSTIKEPKGVTDNVQHSAVKSEAMSTSASTNHSEAFEDDKSSVDTSNYPISSRFGFNALPNFYDTGSNPAADAPFAGKIQSSQAWESNESMTMLFGQTKVEDEAAPLILQSDENLWELGDFVGSSLTLEPSSIESMGSSSCNATALENPQLKWDNGHEVTAAPHLDMLVAGSMLAPYEANAQLWSHGIYPFSPWEGGSISSNQASAPTYVD